MHLIRTSEGPQWAKIHVPCTESPGFSSSTTWLLQGSRGGTPDTELEVATPTVGFWLIKRKQFLVLAEKDRSLHIKCALIYNVMEMKTDVYGRDT